MPLRFPADSRSMRERRLERRFWCADLVRVEWESDQNVRGSAEAVLEDISASGACVQVEEPIPVGAAISMMASCGEGDGEEPCGPNCVGKEAKFSGFVSHCEYRDFGYFVGIRLSDQTRWSNNLFRPQHMMNLGALLDD